MSSRKTGECCVCGARTEKRCGACSAAGFDLFFCSREHQKLVYFAHKQVCGRNAKPFCFPPLTPAEAAEAIEIRHLDIDCDEPSLSGQIEEIIGCAPEGVPVCIRSLTMGNPSSTIGAYASGLLCTVRAGMTNQRVLAATRQHAVSGIVDYRVYASTTPPICRVSNFAVVFGNTSPLPALEGSFPTHENWYNDLLHQLLIYSAIRYVLAQEAAERGVDVSDPSFHSKLEPLLEASFRLLAHMVAKVKKRDSLLGRVLENAVQAVTNGTKLKSLKNMIASL
ncbi:hypothetical protein JCM11251_000915 [Rhodosporidiobolus azoricus]